MFTDRHISSDQFEELQSLLFSVNTAEFMYCIFETDKEARTVMIELWWGMLDIMIKDQQAQGLAGWHDPSDPAGDYLTSIKLFFSTDGQSKVSSCLCIQVSSSTWSCASQMSNCH